MCVNRRVLSMPWVPDQPRFVAVSPARKGSERCPGGRSLTLEAARVGRDAPQDMIHEVDDSLGRLIAEEVLDGSDVEVAFDAPTKDWTTRRNAPTVNIFLYDVREDLARRDVAP